MMNELVKESIDLVFKEQGLSPYQPGEVIYGLDGRLNSLALVRLIVELETRIEDQTGNSVILTDNRVLSTRNSPFRNLESLTQFVEEKVANV